MIGGFEFSGFGTDSPSKAKSREQWLGLQPEGWVTEDLTAPGLAPELSRTAAELANTLEKIGLADDAATIRVDETRRELDGYPAYRLDALLDRPALGRRLRVRLSAVAGAVGDSDLRGPGLDAVLHRLSRQCNDSDRPRPHTAFIGKNPDLPRRATPLHYPLFNSLVYSLETFFPLVIFRPRAGFPIRSPSRDGCRGRCGSIYGSILSSAGF